MSSACTSCGGPLRDGAKFCRSCGAAATPTGRRCSGCGHESPADSKFCRACGASLPDPAAVPTGAIQRPISEPSSASTDGTSDIPQPAAPASRPPDQPPSPGKRHGWAVALGVAGVLLTGVVVAVIVVTQSGNSHRSSPRATAQHQVASSSPATSSASPTTPQATATTTPAATAPASTSTAAAPSTAVTPTTSTTLNSANVDSDIVSENVGGFMAQPLAKLPLTERTGPKDGLETRVWTGPSWLGPNSGTIEERVDMSNAASSLTPEQMAAPQLRTHAHQPGYVLVSTGPGGLTGHASSFQWVFTYKGNEFVDWFFAQCNHTFGVLGVSPTSSFVKFFPVFTDFVNSVQAICN